MPDFNRGKLGMCDSTENNSNLNAVSEASPCVAVPGVGACVAPEWPPHRKARERFLLCSGRLPDSHDQRLGGGGIPGEARKFSNFAGLLPALLFVIAAPAAAQTVIFQETFDNGNVVGPTFATQDIPAYVGPAPLNMTYTADPSWNGSTGCNGVVGAWASAAMDANALASCVGAFPDPRRIWNSAQINLLGLGAFNAGRPNGFVPTVDNATATNAEKQNIGLTAYTNGDPGAPNIILRNATPIPFPGVPAGGSGRFIGFMFTGAVTNCGGGNASPMVSVNLNGTQIGTTLNLCAPPAGSRGYNVAARPDSQIIPGATLQVRVVNYIPTGTGAAPLITGGGLTFTMVNQQSSGTGNDWAFDNFTAIDVSPSVTKTVDIASSYVGQVKRLTFTVTNTSGDNNAKVGWGFTDTLPTNVVIAPTPNATTTCGAGTTLAATAGATTVTVAGGNLIAGTPNGTATTCTISVNVTSNAPGTFTNTQANYTSSTGMNIPNQSVPMTWVANTVTVTKISNGGTDTFNFSGGNGIANHSIATTAAGAPGTAGTQQTLVLTSTTTTTDIVEAATAGWAISGTLGCTVGGVALAGTTWTAGTRTLTLPALPLQAGAARNVQCTFTNQQVIVNADLAITKTNTFAPGQPSDLANDTVARGATTTYTLVATNNSQAVVTGAIVRDVPVSGITCAGTNTVTIDYSGATPDTTSDVATLTGASGIVLGAIGNGETATLTFSCTVN